MAQFFFPSNLNPQGWLTDFLLAQADAKTKKFLYQAAERKALADLEGQVFSLATAHKNKLESIVLPSTLQDPHTIQFKNTVDRIKYHDFMRNITPGVQGALQPYIRLYLKSDKNGKERDIKFKTHTDLDVLLSNRFARGEGAGIKQVSVVRKYPAFGLTRSYNITIEFFFRSMAIFARGASDDKRFRNDYTKLIAPPTFLDDRKESLYLEYGWSVGKNVSEEIIPNDIKQILEAQEKKKLKLSWKNSNFKFEQTGEVLLTAQYVIGADAVARATTESKKKKKNNILQITDVDFLNSLYSKKEFEKIRNASLNLSIVEKELAFLQSPATPEDLKADLCYLKSLKGDKKKEAALQRTKTSKAAAQQKKIKMLNEKASRFRAQVVKNALNALLTSIEKDGQLFKVHFTSKRDEGIHTTKTIIQRHLDFSTRTEFTTTYNLEKVVKSLSENITLPEEETKRIINIISSDVDIGAASLFGDIALARAIQTEGNVDNVLAALCNSDFGEKYPKKSFGNIVFFPLRALINSVYKSIDKKHRKEMPFACLGNVAYRALGKTLWTNIGDVLIELGTFQRWFFTASLKQGLSEWRLDDFLQAVMNDLVPEALNDHSTGEYGNTNFGPIKKEEYVLPPSWKVGRTSHGNSELASIFGGFLFGLRYAEDIKESFIDVFGKDLKRGARVWERNPPGLMYYHQVGSIHQSFNEIVTPHLVSAGGNFDRSEDEALGQIHLNIGDSAGLLKSIQFEQIDNAHLRTALMLQKNSDESIPFLKYAYRANASLVGNNMFSKSAWFVLPLNPLGIEEGEDPGIVGYYRVDEVSDVISAGDYTTSIKGQNLLSNQQIVNRRKQEKIADDPCSDDGRGLFEKDIAAAAGAGNKLLETVGLKKKKKPKIEVYPIRVEHNIIDYVIQFLTNPKISKAYKLDLK